MQSTNRNKLILVISALLLFMSGYSAARPAPGGEHPAYLHALTDLRDARAQLQRPDGGELRDQEKKAIHEIDDAINEIKKASIDDGKERPSCRERTPRLARPSAQVPGTGQQGSQ
jgi:hypothetical protein